MSALAMTAFLCVFLVKMPGLGSPMALEVRNDVECPEGWAYAFGANCVHFFGNKTMLQATVMCQQCLSKIGAPRNLVETVIIYNLAQKQGMDLQVLWFGHHKKYMARVAVDIPICSEKDDLGKNCVQLNFLDYCAHNSNSDPASGSRCWSTVECEMQLPFYCLGRATVLRMQSMDREHFADKLKKKTNADDPPQFEDIETNASEVL